MIGTGNSGHDIAQDLHSSGAEVTLFQRSSTLVVSIEPSAQLVYAPYNEGTLEDNGAERSIRLRSTTLWSAEAVTTTAQPK